MVSDNVMFNPILLSIMLLMQLNVIIHLGKLTAQILYWLLLRIIHQ